MLQTEWLQSITSPKRKPLIPDDSLHLLFGIIDTINALA
jgi:hypothetical protein